MGARLPESLPDRPRNALVGVLDLLVHYLHVGGPAGQELDAELRRTALQGQARAWTLTRLLKPRPLRTLFGDLKDAQRSVGALRRALAFDTHPTLIDGRVREFLLEVAGRCAKDPAELLAQVEAEPAEVASEITPAQWRFFALTNAGEVRWAARGCSVAPAASPRPSACWSWPTAPMSPRSRRWPETSGLYRTGCGSFPGWAQVLIERGSAEPPAREPADVVRLLDRLPPPASLHRDAEAFVVGRLAEALHLAGEPEHARAVLETVVTRHDHHHPAWVQLLTYLVENVGDADWLPTHATAGSPPPAVASRASTGSAGPLLGRRARSTAGRGGVFVNAQPRVPN